eukprot:14188769-Alexandrium_andersonii.AAC.1
MCRLVQFPVDKRAGLSTDQRYRACERCGELRTTFQIPRRRCWGDPRLGSEPFPSLAERKALWREAGRI